MIGLAHEPPQIRKRAATLCLQQVRDGQSCNRTTHGLRIAADDYTLVLVHLSLKHTSIHSLDKFPIQTRHRSSIAPRSWHTFPSTTLRGPTRKPFPPTRHSQLPGPSALGRHPQLEGSQPAGHPTRPELHDLCRPWPPPPSFHCQPCDLDLPQLINRSGTRKDSRVFHHPEPITPPITL